jgi:ligand-binding sensor domain-containing protein/serine phosphatase RsbU (regulator of sigma subunit)
MKHGAHLLLLLAAVCQLAQARAQSYRLRPIGADEGLTGTFVHALAQDAEGHLWIGTGEGAGRYDGIRVKMFGKADGLSENFISSILPTAEGSIWFGHNEGGISHMRGGAVQAMDMDSLAYSTINALAEDGHGGVWAAAQNNGILHVSADGKVKIAVEGGEQLWYGLLVPAPGLLMAGTGNGLRLFRTGTDGSLTPGQDLTGITSASVRALGSDGAGAVYAGTDGEGVLHFPFRDGKAGSATTIGTAEGLDRLMVRDLATGKDGRLIIGTFGQGAYEVRLGQGGRILGVQHYDASNGLGTDNVSAVCLDAEDDLWFARFGMGPARLLDRALVYYAAEEGSAQDVRSVTLHGNDVWLGIQGAILHTRNDDMRMLDTLGAASGLPDDPVTALACGEDGRLWAGTANNGLFRQDERGRFREETMAADRLSRQVHALALHGDETWAGTNNGVYILGPGGMKHLTTDDGLMHNRVNALFPDRSGRMWMACNNGGVSVVQGDLVRSFPLTEGSNAFHVTGVAQDSTGMLWFSTGGSGVRWLQGDSVLGVGAAQGLRSDFCYALAADGHGGIWAGHSGGASRIERTTKAVRSFGAELGLGPDVRIHALAADPARNIWFATDKGALRFETGNERRVGAPPPVHLLSMKVSGKETDFSEPIVLDPDEYRMQFDFLGVSLRWPEAVRYRYKLEGHDPEWTEVTQNSAYYMRVRDGAYTFRVQAAIGDGPWSEPGARVRITVKAPVWKRSWFIAASAVLLSLAAWGLIRLRERSQRKAKLLLQKELGIRTRELVAKNAEIGMKNKDITDSINYAQRIQQAILPARTALSEELPKSFVIHRPRDIVSGDFHWFRRTGDKLLLACADCTGHGVPGAFMSMIGSMLLREISAGRGGSSPEDLLGRLDRELRNVLHYHRADHESKDGMDISVCELDLGSGQLLSAAAMHELVLVQQGRVIRQRGSRRSIGGDHSGNGTQSFELHQCTLHPGDRLYLFSDGIPDQFGGPAGKKLKVSGLVQWLEEMGGMPMHEQEAELARRLAAWMEGHEQVDDMLLIALER